MNSFDLVVKTIIEKAEETANIVEGDYVGEDNLYYCGKCQTRKQTIVNVFGETSACIGRILCCAEYPTFAGSGNGKDCFLSVFRNIAPENVVQTGEVCRWGPRDFR